MQLFKSFLFVLSILYLVACERRLNDNYDSEISDSLMSNNIPMLHGKPESYAPFIEISYYESGMRYVMYDCKYSGGGRAIINVTRDSINAENIKRELIGKSISYSLQLVEKSYTQEEEEISHYANFLEISFYEGGMRYVMYYDRYNVRSIDVINVTLDSLNTLKYSL